METDFGFLMRAYYYFVKWLTTYSNLDEYVLKLHNDDRNAASFVETFFFFSFLVLEFLVSFFSTLGDAPRIDLPLSMFSLTVSVLDSLFSELTLSAGEINTVVLEKAILGEEKSYSNPVFSEAAF